MLLKYFLRIACFECLFQFLYASVPIGIITKRGDELPYAVTERVFNSLRKLDSPNFGLRLVRETVEEEDAASYHRAFCRLLAQDIQALITSTASPYYTILSAYSVEYQIPLISPDLPEASGDVTSPYAIGVRPSTTRIILGLFQLYRWKDIVYIYDHEYGPEKLNLIFVLGIRVLKLTLDGISKVTTAEEATTYLRLLDKSFKNKSFHVVLDTDLVLAREIIRRHIHDVEVKKRNFHFIISQQAVEEFWSSEKTAFGAVNVTGFINKPQNPDYIIPEIKDADEVSKVLAFYYFDAALVVLRAVEKTVMTDYRRTYSNSTYLQEKRDCLKESVPFPMGAKLSRIIKESRTPGGMTGRIIFDTDGQRKDFELNITEVSSLANHIVGSWSHGVLQMPDTYNKGTPSILPLIQNKMIRVTTIISPPYMMLKKSENASTLAGNDRFEGFCKDMLDLLAEELQFDYELHLVEDGLYGQYDKSKGVWKGIIGELIQQKADLAVSDLIITGQRQRVVDFTDPYEMTGFSLVMKNPQAISASSSMFFFLSAFTANVWICILLAAIAFTLLFHFITKYTGAPDSIESASGIWGRKHAILVNIWFSLGTSMMQGTGVYPRSISSRILSGVWWFFTLTLSCLFIASVTTQIRVHKPIQEESPQLSQLKVLSMEAIISESVARGWPKIGVVKDSHSSLYLQKSTLPTFVTYAQYLAKNPDVTVNNIEDGIKRVRESQGGYILLLDSIKSEYAVRQRPCDLVATHDSTNYAGYGLATPMGSALSSNISGGLKTIQSKGALGNLHRKWWVELGHCKKIEIVENESTLYSLSGLFTVVTVAFFLLAVIFLIQYLRKNKNKETRRQQLSFEDMNLGHTLPTPPPELLAEPPPVLNLPEYDKKTLL